MSRIYETGFFLLMMDHAASFNIFNLRRHQTMQQSRIPRQQIPHLTKKNDDGLWETDDINVPQSNVTLPSQLFPEGIDTMDLNSSGAISADFMLPLDDSSLLTSVDRLVKISTKSEESLLLSRISEVSSTFIILLLGTFAVSYLLGDLLVKLEWLQDWRYFWPLVGSLYVADPVMRFFLRNDQEELSNQINPSLLPFDLSKNLGIQLLSVVGGIFTLIGGAYDAFMPVWQTGPNVFTIAGIGQDGAVMLLLVTAISICEENWRKKQMGTAAQHGNVSSNNRLLLQILLLGELYKLAESSVDEILSALESISNSVNGG